ncbi:MAG: dTDP-4-dehydrorhamnose 3,5-epimerase [Solirubrobacteraceae bacterium]
MIFVDTPIVGARVIELELLTDERGAFARTFCAQTFAARGLDSRVDQCNTSFNERSGTLRGMHYQAAPHAEAKLVRCVRGAIYDVAVDLRPESSSFRRWFAVELSEESRRSFFIPAGCAHGFQTLRDGTEVLYQMSTPYVPGAGRGVRWNDPAFAIQWPDPPAGGRMISERDDGYPDFAL